MKVFVIFLLNFRAIDSFLTTLYMKPDFSRANEIHLYLGFMYKELSYHTKALNHLKRVLTYSTPSTYSKDYGNFHIKMIT